MAPTLGKEPVFPNQDSAYLAKFMGGVLSTGLSEVALKRPHDPIEYLAEWLYKYADTQKYLKQQKENAIRIELERKSLEQEKLRAEIRAKERLEIKEKEERLQKEQDEKERARIQEEQENKAKEKEERLKRIRETEGQYAQPPELDTVTEEKEPVTARDQPQEETTEAEHSDQGQGTEDEVEGEESPENTAENIEEQGED